VVTIIKGDCDEAIVKLRDTLRAHDAKFDAQVAAIFKPAAKPAAKRAAASKPAAAAPAGKAKGSAGWGSATSRKPSGGSMRSHLRG
jgi:hypothetical protein